MVPHMQKTAKQMPMVAVLVEMTQFTEEAAEATMTAAAAAAAAQQPVQLLLRK